MIQKKFELAGPVLNAHGEPFPGYSTKSVLNYDRKAIKSAPWRIKEWDFYQITDDKICLQFTIGHASYAGQVCVMMFDFAQGKKLFEVGTMTALPFGSMKMPSDAEKDGILQYKKGNNRLAFVTEGAVRRIECAWDGVETEVVLTRKTADSLVINLPFREKKTCFYYNHKINCMTASAEVRYPGGSYTFKPDNSFGLLDWGRGVWPFSNEWYWSNGTGYADGEMFGFNLGCGFGDSSAATENILFYGGACHKLGEVRFELGSNYSEPWHIHDDEGRLDLVLTPTYDRTTAVKLLWVDNCCHQMFGEFRGYAVLDDGRRLEIEKIYSFAEHAVNNW